MVDNGSSVSADCIGRSVNHVPVEEDREVSEPEWAVGRQPHSECS
jgi:hypothetical protein